MTADPVGMELLIPDCCESEEVVPKKSYFGGMQGLGEYIWFRVKDKLHEPELLDIVNIHEGVIECGRAL